jgi:uncharacterized protein YndB with AHSA1/START domain
MRKVVLTFGLAIGAVFCANIGFMMYWMYHNPNMKSNDIVGYAIMVLVFSLIYFGTKNYRNKYLGGHITFGKAFKTGVLIALVSSTIYVLAWLFSYYLFVPDFMDVYTEYVLKNCTPENLPTKTQEMANFKEMYKNPLFVILITYSEVLPIGLVVALISALILKNKNIKNMATLLMIYLSVCTSSYGQQNKISKNEQATIMDTSNKNSVTSSIKIIATTKEVWDVLIDPNKITKYIGSTIQTDWKKGSLIIWEGEMNGIKYKNKGKVLEVQPNQLLRYTYWSGLGGDLDLPENYSEVTYTIKEVDENTIELTYSRIKIPTELETQIFQSHIKSVLDEIKKIVEAK